MAIKTQTELVTQSDNTFLDNTTGQIIPTNHRLWNEDVLETMFEGIAGRNVTQNQFDQLYNNGELVTGCVYYISGVQLTPNLGVTLIVQAKSPTEVLEISFAQVYGEPHILSNQTDATFPVIKKSFGKGLSVFSLNDFTSSQPSSYGYGLGAEFTITENEQAEPYYGASGKVSHNGDLILNHSLYAEYKAKQGWYKGFIPITNGLGSVFYPDNGVEYTWGTYGIMNAGQFGQLVITPSDNNIMWSINDVRGNFQKVNNTVFGQVHFSCQFDVQQGYNFDFALPFLVNLSNVANLIVNGQASTNNGQHNFLIRGNSVIGTNQDARCTIYIIGNHSGILTIYVDLTFSYTLDY